MSLSIIISRITTRPKTRPEKVFGNRGRHSGVGGEWSPAQGSGNQRHFTKNMLQSNKGLNFFVIKAYGSTILSRFQVIFLFYYKLNKVELLKKI